MKHEIFPTSVWHIKGTPQELVDELYQGAYQFKKRYKNNILSNQGGYQSPPFSWEEFHPVGKEYLKEAISNNIKNPYEIICWWFNINPKDSWNLPHTHPGSDLALVLYLTDTDDLLTFINPFSHRKLSEASAYSPETKKGDVLIFPADVIHFVRPNKRDTDRVSISMNLQLS